MFCGGVGGVVFSKRRDSGDAWGRSTSQVLLGVHSGGVDTKQISSGDRLLFVDGGGGRDAHAIITSPLLASVCSVGGVIFCERAAGCVDALCLLTCGPTLNRFAKDRKAFLGRFVSAPLDVLVRFTI